MKLFNNKYYFFVFIMISFCFHLETATAQETTQKTRNRKTANIEFFGSTRGFFVAPSLAFNKKKHQPYLGLLLGRHHTFNSRGLGLNIGDRYYLNERQHPFNLFLIGSIQFIAFTNFSSPSVNSILNFQMSGGYGIDYKINPKLSLSTYFSLGFILELRTFKQNFNDYGSLDSAGILSLGMNYILGK